MQKVTVRGKYSCSFMEDRNRNCGNYFELYLGKGLGYFSGTGFCSSERAVRASWWLVHELVKIENGSELPTDKKELDRLCRKILLRVRRKR